MRERTLTSVLVGNRVYLLVKQICILGLGHFFLILNEIHSHFLLRKIPSIFLNPQAIPLIILRAVAYLKIDFGAD